jgi:hypothetical protein
VGCRSCGCEQPAARACGRCLCQSEAKRGRPALVRRRFGAQLAIEASRGALMPVGLADADYMGCILASYSFVV